MFSYSIHNEINLHVKEHISYSDARRQLITAKHILKKLEYMPGQILADEVGMGKTFVALAVAVSIALDNNSKQPVVIMIPSNLSKKWPSDLDRFIEFCLPNEQKKLISYGVASNGVQFLKYLDDPKDRRKQIVFLTHGSFTRSLTDGWVKLAIIQRALYRKKNIDSKRKALEAIISQLLNMGWVEKKDKNIWNKLLKNDPKNWLNILKRSGIDPENDNNLNNDDDPIPGAIISALYEDMDTKDFDKVFNSLNIIPLRKSKHFNKKVTEARIEINKSAKEVWNKCSKKIPYHIPLLILDEAHHLKNARTRLASLFESKESNEDTREATSGTFAGVFERMLFLTATPFQLGHHELCEVLNRFKGINWKGKDAPNGGLEYYERTLEKLKKSLDESQIKTTLLDEHWSKLENEDKIVDEIYYDDENLWWNALKSAVNTNTNQKRVLNSVNSCEEVIKNTELLLRKFLIRHIKQQEFKFENELVQRRIRWNGKEILEENPNPNQKSVGLTINGSALLPFLLSARHAIKNKDERPVFAEGIASSYEAFLKTKELKFEELIDNDDENGEIIKNQNDWYLENLYKYIGQNQFKDYAHPKIKATVSRVIDLWEKGEKVLVFCHFIQTGKALRTYISEEMKNRINVLGAKKLNCSENEVEGILLNISKNKLRSDGNIKTIFDIEIDKVLENYLNEIETSEWKRIKDVIFRYLRTNSFLVRYFPIGKQITDFDFVLNALKTKGRSGESLLEMIKRFIHFQAKKCTKKDRESYLDALDSIQSGYISGEDFNLEESDKERLKFIPNVRLANGSTQQVARQTLMKTFNTPFFPEVLIASSVMAEGVDLHLNCRHVIHHDLCWNPSTLEQRTGRVDRIGSKGEITGKPVNVYIPFIEETQDEKMFRVVIDRERWFKIVMGEKFKSDTESNDVISERLPLPLEVINSLSFDLSVI